MHTRVPTRGAARTCTHKRRNTPKVLFVISDLCVCTRCRTYLVHLRKAVDGFLTILFRSFLLSGANVHQAAAYCRPPTSCKPHVRPPPQAVRDELATYPTVLPAVCQALLTNQFALMLQGIRALVYLTARPPPFWPPEPLGGGGGVGSTLLCWMGAQLPCGVPPLGEWPRPLVHGPEPDGQRASGPRRGPAGDARPERPGPPPDRRGGATDGALPRQQPHCPKACGGEEHTTLQHESQTKPPTIGKKICGTWDRLNAKLFPLY